jgi:hypothetical protein
MHITTADAECWSLLLLAQTARPDVPAGVFSKLQNRASSLPTEFQRLLGAEDLEINRIEIEMKISLRLTIMRMEMKLELKSQVAQSAG